MSARTPITIESMTFESKVAATRYTREIIHRTADEQPLTGQDERFVAALFKRHPDYPARTANRTIRYFTVSTAKGGTRCFYVAYVDGGRMEDFSFKNCL